MTQEKEQATGYGLFRNYGWKTNLKRVLIGFLIFVLLDIIASLFSSVRLISEFDPSIAATPLIGFFLGIWGVLGCLLGSIVVNAIAMGIYFDLEIYLTTSYFFFSWLTTLIYCCLPCILWYAIKLPGEDHVSFPRFDTTKHLLKYYLIMVFSVALYVFLTALSTGYIIQDMTLMNWFVLFAQYLDAVLVIGIPLAIVISQVKYHSISINERMVISFVILAIVASFLSGYIVYLSYYYHYPNFFDTLESWVTLEVMPDNWEEIAHIYQSFQSMFYAVIVAVFNLILVLEIFLMNGIEKKVTNPIIHLSNVLEEYTEDKDPKPVKNNLSVYSAGYGEVSNLTRTSVNMVTEINDYTINLQEATAKQERLGAELEIASDIQRDMLPGVFPPFPDRTEIDLYASMTPAREVGGDFYDFYFVDRDHLALVIGDVSDKGIPAAMFMVTTKTLIQNHAQNGCSPKEILTYANHTLTQNNSSLMFCTVWLGILNLCDGHLVYANAGHEYSLIGSEGNFEYLRDEHDIPLGLRDGIRYHENELYLQPGDCLLQYTDGVTEASDNEKNMFGEDRLLKTVNLMSASSAEEIINHIYDSINIFVKGAEQFDDTTMLCLRYLGNSNSFQENHRGQIVVPAQTDKLYEVTSFVEQQLEAVDSDAMSIFNFTLAAEEIFVNIANYAYDGKDGTATIDFYYSENEKVAELVFTDSGIPFDPTTRKAPDITLPVSERPVGGLGIHIVKKIMDQVVYEYAGGHNILALRSKINHDN